MGKRALKQAVFLDRDGVLNHVVMRDGQPASPRSPAEFRLCESAAEVVMSLRAHGYLAILISNQPDLSRGRLTQADHHLIMQHLLEAIELDDVYVCPDDSHESSEDKKPNPGMLLRAAEVNGISLARSFMIGDTWKDMEAARRAGCEGILIDCPYNQNVSSKWRVASLRAAAAIILNQGTVP